MEILFPLCIIIAAFIFCVSQFCHLMQRRDDEFRGRNDKLIWALTILLTNVLGAFLYWLSRDVAPKSRRPLQREHLQALEELAAGSTERGDSW